MPQPHEKSSEFSALPAPDRYADSGYDASSELVHVDGMIEKGLKYLSIACNQMERVEHELDRFISDYYAQVGSYFEELEQIKREIARYDQQIAQSRRRSKAADPVALEALPMPLLSDALKDKQELEAERKAIYRKLVKLYHPDLVPAKNRAYAHEVVQLINEAYEKRNLWAMREMEHSLTEHAHADDKPAARLKRLRERFDAIATSVMKVTERRKCLEASVAWQLKQRVAQDPYLIEVVIHRAKQQIEEAGRILFQKKLDYQAVLR